MEPEAVDRECVRDSGLHVDVRRGLLSERATEGHRVLTLAGFHFEDRAKLLLSACHERLALVVEMVDQIMAVGAEPGEVIEAVVAAIFVEVVDGEEALVGQAAPFADLSPVGAQQGVAIACLPALPIAPAP